MTVVVALVDNKKNEILMGSDTYTENSFFKTEIGEKFFKKQISFNNESFEIIIGYSGYLKYKDLLNYKINWKANEKEYADFIDYYINYILPQIKEEVKIEDSNSSLLIIYAGDIYEVSNFDDILKIKGDFHAIGSGYPYALGSLETSRKTIDDDIYYTPYNRVKRALWVTEYFSNTCHGNVVRVFKI